MILQRIHHILLALQKTHLNAKLKKIPSFIIGRNKKGGEKMVFTRKELLAERLEDFETKSTETICIELLIS